MWLELVYLLSPVASVGRVGVGVGVGSPEKKGKDFHPPKLTAGGPPQKYSLEKVTPFKYGQCLVFILDFGGVIVLT